MFPPGSLKQAITYIAVICLGVFIGMRLSNAISPSVTAASAQPSSAVSEAPIGPAASYVCTPDDVTIWTNRIHVRCTVAAPGGIQYFALATVDSKQSARMLSLLLTAKAVGKNVVVLYNASDLSGASIGCQTNDCRLIQALALVG